MLFMAEAAENKLEVTKPLGDSAHYDFAVEHQGKLARVQVKSTVAKCGRGYGCTVPGEPGSVRAQRVRLLGGVFDPGRDVVHHSSQEYPGTMGRLPVSEPEQREVRTIPRSLAPVERKIGEKRSSSVHSSLRRRSANVESVQP